VVSGRPTTSEDYDEGSAAARSVGRIIQSPLRLAIKYQPIIQRRREEKPIYSGQIKRELNLIDGAKSPLNPDRLSRGNLTDHGGVKESVSGVSVAGTSTALVGGEYNDDAVV
jgi:hypothetical protein